MTYFIYQPTKRKTMNKRIAMVTGASSGIGRACAEKFAQGGYNLIITGRDTEKLHLLKEQLEAQGATVQTLVFDIRHREAATTARSEEHTSELQSRQYLVCRLLLEKKKPKTRHSSTAS